MPLKSGQPIATSWSTINRQGAQGSFHKGEIVSARDAIENRRARILLGGAGAMQLASPMEYDLTQAYAGQTWVHVGTSNIAATTGTTDPDSGKPVKSTPGWYCSCAGGVPLAGTEDSPAYHIPQIPLPNTDVDNALNYWVIFIADAQCY